MWRVPSSPDVSNGSGVPGTFARKLLSHDHSYKALPSTDLATHRPPRAINPHPELSVMRRSMLFSSVAAVLLMSSSAFAQAKPNFTGKWTLLPDPTQPGAMRGGAAMGGLGDEATITQDDKTISVSRQGPNGLLTTAFNLDGSESHQTIDVGNGNLLDLALKASWDGAKLSTWTAFDIQGQQMQIQLMFALDDKGNLVTTHTTP